MIAMQYDDFVPDPASRVRDARGEHMLGSQPDVTEAGFSGSVARAVGPVDICSLLGSEVLKRWRSITRCRT